MASVFRRVKKQPLPEGARVVERKGGRVAEWLDANGKRRTAPLSKDGSGIRVESATYTVQFMDEHGHPQRVYDCLIELHDMNWRRRQVLREKCPHAVLIDHSSHGFILPAISAFGIRVRAAIGSLCNGRRRPLH